MQTSLQSNLLHLRMRILTQRISPPGVSVFPSHRKQKTPYDRKNGPQDCYPMTHYSMKNSEFYIITVNLSKLFINRCFINIFLMSPPCR